MSSPQWQQASEIVHAALKRPLAQRATFINTVCAGNEALLQEVEILLRYYATTEHSPTPPAQTPPAEPLKQWWQPPTNSRSSDAANGDQGAERGTTNRVTNTASLTEFWAQTPAAGDAELTNTTEEIPAPIFEDRELVSIPPRQDTVEIINELARGFETIPIEQARPQMPSGNIPPPPASFGQPSQRQPNATSGQSGEVRPPNSFDSPTVRPVFEQPSPGSGVSQPTYRPIFDKTPKPATPLPTFDPTAPPLHEDFPSLSPPDWTAPRPAGRFDQTSQRPDFNQPSQRSQPGPFEQRSQRLNFDQPSVRGVAGNAPPTGALGGATAAGAAPAPAPGQTAPGST